MPQACAPASPAGGMGGTVRALELASNCAELRRIASPHTSVFAFPTTCRSSSAAVAPLQRDGGAARAHALRPARAHDRGPTRRTRAARRPRAAAATTRGTARRCSAWAAAEAAAATLAPNLVAAVLPATKMSSSALSANARAARAPPATRRRRRRTAGRTSCRASMPARRALTHACASAGTRPWRARRCSRSPPTPTRAKPKLSSAGADRSGRRSGRPPRPAPLHAERRADRPAARHAAVARVRRRRRAVGRRAEVDDQAVRRRVAPAVVQAVVEEHELREGLRADGVVRDFVLRFFAVGLLQAASEADSGTDRQQHRALSVVDGAAGTCGVGDSISSSSRTAARLRANFRQRSREESDPRVARMRLAMLILTLLGIASGLSSMPASVGSVVRSDRAAVRMNADDSVESKPAAAARLAELKADGARARARRDEQSAMASAALALAREREPVKRDAGHHDGAAGNRVSCSQ